MKHYLLFLLGVSLLCNTLVKAQDEDFGKSESQLVVDNISRSFIVYVPKSYNTSKKSPIIFLFHGGGGRARSILNISDENDFKTISEQHNVILVAPNGIDKSWNDGRATKANKQHIDDVKFFNQLLRYIISNYSVDTTRIYATGISNGGFMVSRLACEVGNKFAAVAVVSATMGKEVPYSTCTPNFTLPVMYIHGTTDPIIPFLGAERSLGAEGAFISHQQVIDKWVFINKCNPTPVVTQLPDIANDETTITKREYMAGKEGATVISYTINNGGHTWPGGKQYLPKRWIGNVSYDMNACQVMWDFFNQYKR